MSRLFKLLAVLAVAAAVAPLSAGAAEGTKGKTVKRGGYSYSQADSINTYGDNRGRYGSANSLRDPQLDRQTNAGPFDHGFFYDSGIGTGQHGNDSPYLH